MPAPGSPVPARSIGERDLRVGAVVVHVIPAPASATRGEWSDALQPAFARVYLTRASRE